MTAAEQPFYLFTSVPPRLSGDELQHQREIISSWRAAGFTPVTVNGPSEIAQIAAYNLEIEIETASDDGKPLLSDILTAIRKKHGHRAGIINADCKMLEYPHLTATLEAVLENGLLYAERVDIGDGRPPTVGDCQGFDAFFFNVGLLRGVNDSHMRLGETWWDYWLPLRLAANGAVLGNIGRPVIVHRRHAARWSEEGWFSNARRVWTMIKGWRHQNAIPAFISSLNFDTSSDSLDRGQIVAFSGECFQWLRTRKFPRELAYLSHDLEDIEGLFPDIASSERESEPSMSWPRRLNRKRLGWQRRIFGRRRIAAR